MKKTTRRPLELRSQTLRRLTDRELSAVAGGQIRGGKCTMGMGLDPDSCSTLQDTNCDTCTDTSANLTYTF